MKKSYKIVIVKGFKKKEKIKNNLKVKLILTKNKNCI